MTSPKVRRQARECALQFLFGLDFTQYECWDALPGFWAANPVKPGVERYAEELIRGVMTWRELLDRLIGEALQNWSPDRVGRVEQNILRVALFEMKYGRDVPIPVAINEAIEVAKRFGTAEAPRFVNGVLDRLKDAISPEETNPAPKTDADEVEEPE